jgi:hypothetical protein
LGSVGEGFGVDAVDGLARDGTAGVPFLHADHQDDQGAGADGHAHQLGDETYVVTISEITRARAMAASVGAG